MRWNLLWCLEFIITFSLLYLSDCKFVDFMIFFLFYKAKFVRPKNPKRLRGFARNSSGVQFIQTCIRWIKFSSLISNFGLPGAPLNTLLWIQLKLHFLFLDTHTQYFDYFLHCIKRISAIHGYIKFNNVPHSMPHILNICHRANVEDIQWWFVSQQILKIVLFPSNKLNKNPTKLNALT